MDASFVRPEGHDGGPAFLDGLGKLFVAVAIVWTCVLFAGILYLFAHRLEPSVRVRNLPLAVSAALCLHVYWVLCMIAYPMNGSYPCYVEFWIMSIYLPLGIALFQANNIQLLSVACLQRRMLLSSSDLPALKVKPSARTLRRYWLQFNGMSLLRRTEFAIAVGMIVQFAISIALFMASRKFTSFGLFSNPVDAETCRRGPEWIPSTIWQLTWAWFFAPFVLWKIRHIDDVHHWRQQTTICVIAALLGSPLWIASLYSSSSVWAAVNKYWLPPLWFAPGIMVIQAATILAPCVNLMKNIRSQRYVARALSEWENRRRHGEVLSSGLSAPSDMTTPSKLAQSTVTTMSKTSRHGEIYSRDALEQDLAGDDSRLLEFAVHKEFTGENISFLLCTREWKAGWNALLDENPGYDWDTDAQGYRRLLFEAAVKIFVDLVEVSSADFPLNIEAGILMRLRRTFSEAHRALNRPSTNVATPFLFDSPPRTATGSASDSKVPVVGSATELVGLKSLGGSATESTVRLWRQDKCLGMHKNIVGTTLHLPDSVRVPHDFSITIFDRAEESVKMMVLQKTWPRFVDTCLLAESKPPSEGDAEKGLLHRFTARMRG